MKNKGTAIQKVKSLSFVEGVYSRKVVPPQTYPFGQESLFTAHILIFFEKVVLVFRDIKVLCATNSGKFPQCSFVRTLVRMSKQTSKQHTGKGLLTQFVIGSQLKFDTVWVFHVFIAFKDVTTFSQEIFSSVFLWDRECFCLSVALLDGGILRC